MTDSTVPSGTRIPAVDPDLTESEPEDEINDGSGGGANECDKGVLRKEDGKTTCRRCDKTLPTSDFALSLLQQCWYMCRKCHAKYVKEHNTVWRQIRYRLRKEEMKRLGSHMSLLEKREIMNQYPLLVNDKAVEDHVVKVWNSRSAVSNKGFPLSCMVLTRWNPKQLPVASNMVLLQQGEAKVHDARMAVTVGMARTRLLQPYSEETLRHVNEILVSACSRSCPRPKSPAAAATITNKNNITDSTVNMKTALTKRVPERNGSTTADLPAIAKTAPTFLARREPPLQEQIEVVTVQRESPSPSSPSPAPAPPLVAAPTLVPLPPVSTASPLPVPLPPVSTAVPLPVPLPPVSTAAPLPVAAPPAAAPPAVVPSPLVLERPVEWSVERHASSQPELAEFDPDAAEHLLTIHLNGIRTLMFRMAASEVTGKGKVLTNLVNGITEAAVTNDHEKMIASIPPLRGAVNDLADTCLRVADSMREAPAVTPAQILCHLFVLPQRKNPDQGLDIVGAAEEEEKKSSNTADDSDTDESDTDEKPATNRNPLRPTFGATQRLRMIRNVVSHKHLHRFTDRPVRPSKKPRVSESPDPQKKILMRWTDAEIKILRQQLIDTWNLYHDKEGKMLVDTYKMWEDIWGNSPLDRTVEAIRARIAKQGWTIARLDPGFAAELVKRDFLTKSAAKRLTRHDF